MSLLKFYTSSRTLECLKVGYGGRFLHTILWQDGNYIPAWDYETDDTVTMVYLEVVNPLYLKNGSVVISSSTDITTSGYTTGTGNDRNYAEKQAETLADDTVYRLKITTSGDSIYSEIFKKAN